MLRGRQSKTRRQLSTSFDFPRPERGGQRWRLPLTAPRSLLLCSLLPAARQQLLRPLTKCVPTLSIPRRPDSPENRQSTKQQSGESQETKADGSPETFNLWLKGSSF